MFEIMEEHVNDMNWGAGRRVELFDKRELEKEMRENQKSF